MNKDATVTIRLPEIVKAYLEEVAGAQMLSLSDVIRMYLAEKMPDYIKADLQRSQK